MNMIPDSVVTTPNNVFNSIWREYYKQTCRGNASPTLMPKKSVRLSEPHAF